MKTFGNIATRELISLIETTPYGFDAPGYHVEQLCPPGKFHKADDRAPWNAFHNSDPAYWRTEYPAAWSNVADDDPSAPWNAPEPNRDPTAYLDDKGEPLYWETPKLVPLVKLPRPEHDELTHYVEPKLVWFEDRVERDWEILPIPASVIENRATQEALAAVKRAAAERLRLLYADYQVQPEGFSLAMQESDQNAFTRLLTLLQTANIPINTPIQIAF